jgi:hypothetical protein
VSLISIAECLRIRELTIIFQAFLQLSPLQPLRCCRSEAMLLMLVSRTYEHSN